MKKNNLQPKYKKAGNKSLEEVSKIVGKIEQKTQPKDEGKELTIKTPKHPGKNSMLKLAGTVHVPLNDECIPKSTLMEMLEEEIINHAEEAGWDIDAVDPLLEHLKQRLEEDE